MKLMGHRGAKGELPENTLVSIEHALKLGIDAIEIDVHKTKDGKIVVIHDDTVNRTTNGEGKILDFTFDEIRELDAGDGQMIPTLKEVLSLIENYKKELQIEVKAADLEEILVNEINESNVKDLITVISFNHRILKIVKEIDSSIKTACLLYGITADPVGVVKAANADGLSLSISLVDEQTATELHENDMSLTVWNISTHEQYEHFKKLGADRAGTDYPSKFLK